MEVALDYLGRPEVELDRNELDDTSNSFLAGAFLGGKALVQLPDSLAIQLECHFLRNMISFRQRSSGNIARGDGQEIRVQTPRDIFLHERIVRVRIAIERALEPV